jgi:purine-nucleoside phosphorylase
MRQGRVSESSLYERIQETSAFLRTRLDGAPRFGLILGTGLGNLVSQIEAAVSIPYDEIPHFMPSTAESHAGNLVGGRLGGQDVVAMQGRVHYYEGYSMQQITFPVRVMKALGVDTLIASNAAGGMNPLYRPGDLVAIVDHINLMGGNPLLGPNDERLGERFPDMSEPYDRALLKAAHSVALEERIPLKEGVLAAVAGPNLETRAEYRFLRWAGADLVSMSLVPEAIVAAHAGMRLLAFAVVTDLCLPDALEAVDIGRILANAAKAEPSLTRLVTRVLAELPPRTGRA